MDIILLEALQTILVLLLGLFFGFTIGRSVRKHEEETDTPDDVSALKGLATCLLGLTLLRVNRGNGDDYHDCFHLINQDGEAKSIHIPSLVGNSGQQGEYRQELAYQVGQTAMQFMLEQMMRDGVPLMDPHQYGSDPLSPQEAH